MATELRYTAATQIEHLQARYVGTGHADTTKYEWATNIARDTSASIIGHPALLAYVAAGDGESIGRMRANLVMGMVQPCGPPLLKEDAV